MKKTNLLFFSFFFLYPYPGYTSLYKCSDNEGIVSFQQMPCAEGELEMNIPAYLLFNTKIKDISSFEIHGVRLGLDRVTVDAIMSSRGFKITKKKTRSTIYELNNGNFKSVIRVAYTLINSDSNNYAYKYSSNGNGTRKVYSYSFNTYSDAYETVGQYEKYLSDTFGEIFFIYRNESFSMAHKNIKRVRLSLSRKTDQERFIFDISVSKRRNKIYINGKIKPKERNKLKQM